MEEKYFSAIDIGESYTKVVVMSYYASKLLVVASSIVKSAGIKNGDISNINDLQMTVKEAITNCETQLNSKIESLIVVLPSSKMKVYDLKAAGEFLGDEHLITSIDINNLKKKIASEIPKDELVINFASISYKLNDDKVFDKEPLGLSARKIEINAKVLSLPSFVARSYVNVVQNMDYEVSLALLEPLAYDELLDKGTMSSKLVIDIGGESTLVSYFNSDNLVSVQSLKVGAGFLTKKISEEFDLSLERAESLKREYGNANIQTAEHIPIYHDVAREVVITEIDLAKVISNCLEEYLNDLSRLVLSLTKNAFYSISLIGGGSHLNGLEDIIMNRLSREVNCYVSMNVGARSNAFVPAIGAIKYYLSHKMK